MSMMKIEVVPDPTVSTGGHAIIRLKGVALLPPGATVRIEPIDETLADDDGWPQGDIKPIETRQTPEGLELRVGPSVVDAPLLEPGMPVTITVADAHLSEELVWPTLPVSTGAVEAPVVMSASQMAAEFAAVERAKVEAKRIAAEFEAKLERDRREAEEASRRNAAVAAAIATAVVAEEPPSNQIKTAPAAHPGALNGLAIPPMFEAARQLDAVLASDKPIDPPAAGRTAPEPLSALANPAPVKARGGDEVDTLSRLTRPVNELPAHGADAISTDRDSSLPAVVVKQANEAAAARATALEPIAGAQGAKQSSGVVPFLLGFATAAAALAMVVIGGPKTGLIPELVSTAPATTSRPVIADAFMAGPQSPRGEIATNIDLPTALRLADYNMHGIDRPVDRAEAEFWLKKALSLTASHTQLRWALTQLGTLAAQPVSGAPDYEKARLLWEISAGNGDPVALCFLGTLAESGLGAPADRGKALEYYKRSKEIGGCPGTDEAIARLSR